MIAEATATRIANSRLNNLGRISKFSHFSTIQPLPFSVGHVSAIPTIASTMIISKPAQAPRNSANKPIIAL